MDIDCDTSSNDVQIVCNQSETTGSQQNAADPRNDLSSNEKSQDRLSFETVNIDSDSPDRLSPEAASVPEESTDSRLSAKSADSSLSTSIPSNLPGSISTGCQNGSSSQSFSDRLIDLEGRLEHKSSTIKDSGGTISFPSQNTNSCNVENGNASEENTQNNSLVHPVEERDETCNINEESNTSLSNDQTSLDTTANKSNEDVAMEVSESISKDNSEVQNEGDTSSNGILIEMVTSLTDASNESFVEPPQGPNSPVLSAINPLETDTVDAYSADKNVANESDVSLGGIQSHEGEKDNDEVITADKALTSVYGKKNSSGSPLSPSVNHGTSKKGKDDSKRQLKVILPNKKVGETGKFPVTRLTNSILRSCLQCKKVSQCLLQMEIGGNAECYLCSDECLQKQKAHQLNIQLPAPAVDIPADKRDFGPDCRLCVNCDTVVSALPQDAVLSWETMEFCDEDCLGKYMSKMWAFCSACKKEVPTSSMGKYCVRFGHEVKQFCAGSCLEEFKKGIKVCSYCQKDLSDGEGFLAPIGDKGQFRDFCTQRCLEEYDCMSRNLPLGGMKIEPCGVCNNMQIVQIQVVTSSNNVNLCSEVCLAAFKFVNTTISTAPCFMCKKFYDKSLSSCVTIFYDNELLSFCSKSCMNVSILSKRKIVNCHWCKVKKYNFDMIKKKPKGLDSQFYCSVNCMALFKVSAKAVSHKSIMSCTQCKKLDFPNLHLTMSDATVRNFCSIDCVNKFQATFAQSGAQANGVVPTGPPKRVFKNNVPLQNSDGNTTTPENVSAVGPSPQNIPKVQMKKTGDIQLVNQAANGPSGTMSPQNFAPQLVKFQVLVVPPLGPEKKNANVQVQPNMVSKAVSAETSVTSQGVQTEETNTNENEVEDSSQKLKGPVMIPVPVPIYIPCPMAMYSIPAPTPFPFPIPVAVPVFIPTTKGTAEEILADIKRIQEKIPGNPYEAELIMMAELEQQKSKAAADSPSSPGSDNHKVGQKRPLSSGDDVDCSDSGGPPEKRLREEPARVNDIFEGVVVQQLSSPGLPMSLKETLGVSAWRHYAAEVGEKKNLLEMTPTELAQALKGFILNAKIPRQGHYYTPDQKYYLLLGIQYYLDENGRIDNIFFDTVFDPFIDSLNLEAKKFITMFEGSDNVVTRVEEEHLWESKQLGPYSPYSLLQTLIYFNTKCFNLTTVEEHMQLSFSHILKQYKRNLNAPPGSQTNSNGGRNVVLRFYPPQSIIDRNPKKRRMYEQNANDQDPYKCPIYLYEFYMSKCPESVKSRTDMFYMSPERSCVPDSPIWYSTLPLSQDIIERTLNRFKMVKEINLAIHSPV